MFHHAFFNSIIDKHQHMHFTFNIILVKNADFNVKIHIKIHKNTPTCFDHNRSSSGIILYLVTVTELFKKH